MSVEYRIARMGGTEHVAVPRISRILRITDACVAIDWDQSMISRAAYVLVLLIADFGFLLVIWDLVSNVRHRVESQRSPFPYRYEEPPMFTYKSIQTIYPIGRREMEFLAEGGRREVVRFRTRKGRDKAAIQIASRLSR